MPKGAKAIYRYRELCALHGDEKARELLLAEHHQQAVAEAARPKTFEQQLERARNGARLVAVQHIRRPDPSGTLGGIATAAL